MKKTLLKTLALVAGAFLSFNAMADNSPVGPILSIQDALNARAEALHPKVAGAVDPDLYTHIYVINYSETSIKVFFPTGAVELGRHQATMYHPAYPYNSPSHITLTTTGGATFFDAMVDYQNMLSVHVDATGKYVVYNTR